MKNLLSIFAVLLLLASFSGCSKDNDDDVNVRASKVVADPSEQDDDDKVLNKPAKAATRGCRTYSSYKFVNGRQGWKIYRPLWREFSRASVTFSDGYYVPTVIMSKANRINTGEGRGFCLRPMTSSTGVFIQAPYGNSSKYVKLCPK